MRSLEFDIAAFEDLAWWIEQDRSKALRIVDLIKDVQRNPFKGTGKPEPLKHEFKGCWSWLIDATFGWYVPWQEQLCFTLAGRRTGVLRKSLFSVPIPV